MGNVYELGDGIKLTILGPVGTHNDINNHSVVTRLDYGNVSFLFTGDVESRGERDLVESGQPLRATVLDVGHHGSYSSTNEEFLRRVSPEIAVIQVGATNTHGHPHGVVMNRLNAAGVRVYRTDLHGTVVVTSNGTILEVNTQR
jgi:competence protein ComEC